jgi:hypothetical protein
MQKSGQPSYVSPSHTKIHLLVHFDAEQVDLDYNMKNRRNGQLR